MSLRSVELSTKLLAGVAVGTIAVAAGGLFLVLRQSTDEWQSHEQAAFSVEAPASWQLTVEKGHVEVAGDSERVVVWPFFVEGALADGASSVAAKLATKAAPELSWTTSTAAEGLVRLEGSSAETRGLAVLAYRQSKPGAAGTLYVASAPADEFEADTATFARVLASFVARGAPIAERPAPTYETWRDPVEGAFSVEVPTGWTTRGGTSRPSTLLVQAGVTTSSPDSEITAVMTDAFPLYVEPNATLAFGGIYEGGTYVDQTGYSSPVRRYTRGAQYVTDFVLPDLHPGARITRFESVPALAQQLASYGINTYDVGEIEYRFTQNGAAYKGAGLCVTERISTGGYVAWHVWRLFLVEAPAARYGEGLAALDRLAASLRIDEAWAAQQSETTRQQSGIIAQMSSDIGDTLSSGYWGRQQVYDEIFERRSKATLEVEDVMAENGDTFRVDSGSEYYWMDPQGTIVGTDTSTRPDVDFTELLRLDT